MKRGNVSIMLVLIIMMLSVITTAAVAIAISTTLDTTTLTLGERALTVAESGAENAILRLLRDPAYSGEANLPIGPGTATIGVTGASPKIITSSGTVNDLTRQIQVTITITSGQLTVTNWQEI